jgi:hypothetical protein
MSMKHGVRTRRGGVLLRLASCLALILLGTLPALAQVSTASVEARVTDVDGGALPGVTVTLENVETGLTRVAVTGESGDVSVSALPPGTYKVTFELQGFSPVSQEDVALRVGQTVQIRTELSAAVAESITVSSTVPLVDVYKTDTSTNIVPEQIESLPVPDRDFQRLAFIAPGVQRERGGFRFIGGGPVVGAGGNASQSTILVNGVDFTDPALGLSKIRFSQDAISEFRVMNNRYDTEVGGTAGGALSIITRGGTNRMAGTVFGFHRADDLREPGALEQEGADFSRSQYGFTLGGPITQDKIHYFVSFEQINEDNVAFFRPGGAFAEQADDVEHPFDQTLGFARLGYILSEAHTLSGNLAYEKYEEENFRVGGLVSPAAGQQLNRDNWNLTLEDLGVLGSRGLNELRLQAGTRKYDEPTNSNAVSEWFSSGNTIQTGSNILGDLLGEGDMYELRDTFHWNTGSHDVKLGASVLHTDERLRIDTFQEGLFIYVTDTRALPLAYSYGEGSADVTLDSTRYAVFLQDEWRPRANLSLNAGLRYDLDDGGNNPGFTHPLVPEGRDKDTDDYQPRLSFSWDPSNRGSDVIRGGVGMFNGRFLLVPALTELQQNGITGGRISRTRVNGALLGLNFPPFILDPNNPRNTGVLLNPDISLLAPDLETPESVQASLGWTHRFGASRFFLDTEGVWAEGDNEIVIRDVNFGGNANPVRLNRSFNQINMYTNDGRSEYTALILRLNGTMRQTDLVTASVTFADKKNISDDFSPVFPFGYPNDPSNIDAEFGRSQADERYRVVLTGIFHLPWQMTVAPIYEYGSGQPWSHRLGYDFNGDGKNSDRPAGVKRNDEEGPSFKQLSLRLAKGFTLLGDNRFDLILEGFNVLNNTNYDVNSIDTAEFLSGPTLVNPALPFRANPNFGRFRATLPGREIQLGVKWVF